jgi:transposase-like protein
MNEDQAFQRFTELSYADTGGKPVCPGCNCDAVYIFKRWNADRSICRTIFKCKRCDKQFTPTSSTAFRYRKLPYRDLLLGIALFALANKGRSALEIFSWLKCDYTSAMMMNRKLRDVMEMHLDRPDARFEGEVEADTCWIGGYKRPKNLRVELDSSNPNRLKRNPWEYKELGPSKKSVTVVIQRGRGGRVFAAVADAEIDSLAFIQSNTSRDTILFTDKSSIYDGIAWDVKDHLVVNHTLCFATGEANTNTAESFFSGLKRTSRGIYHRTSHPTLAESFVKERAWRTQHSHLTTGERFNALMRAIRSSRRSRHAGAWQRRPSGELRRSE